MSPKPDVWKSPGNRQPHETETHRRIALDRCFETRLNSADPDGRQVVARIFRSFLGAIHGDFYGERVERELFCQ